MARLSGERRAIRGENQRRLVPPLGRLPAPPGRPPRLVLRLAVGREPGRGAEEAAIAGASSDSVAFGWRWRSARGATSPDLTAARRASTRAVCALILGSRS